VYKGNYEQLSDVFSKAAVEQGISKNAMDAYFAEFNFKIHEMIQNMAKCKTCLEGVPCPDHVFEQKQNVKDLNLKNEGYYKVKELIPTQTHDKLKEFLY